MVLGADAAVGVLRQTLFAFERKSSALLIADDAASADDIEVRSKFCWSKFTLTVESINEVSGILSASASAS